MYVYKINTNLVIGNGSKSLFPLGTVNWNAVSLEPFVPALPSSVEEIYIQEQTMQPLQTGTSLVAQTVKRLSTMWETQVRALGWEDPLEKGMAIHSSILTWRVPWTEESTGLQRVGHD